MFVGVIAPSPSASQVMQPSVERNTPALKVPANRVAPLAVSELILGFVIVPVPGLLHGTLDRPQSGDKT
jgi:hypothetical protein